MHTDNSNGSIIYWLFWVVCIEPKMQLLVGRQYVVGRRDCDIFVPNDMSISRRHAIIKIIYAESDIVSHLVYFWIVCDLAFCDRHCMLFSVVY